MKRFFRLVVAIVVCELAGAVGSVFTAGAVAGWYGGLVRPALNPPSWVFGPVWVTLYALMGIAAWLVWERGGGKALAIFSGQLVLNASWSIVFFGLRSPGLALVNIALLWLAIVWTGAAFYRISRPAAYLLLPYFLWVSFAVYLNFFIWRLN